MKAFSTRNYCATPDSYYIYVDVKIVKHYKVSVLHKPSIDISDNPLPAGAGSLGAEAEDAVGRKADMTSMGSGKMTVVLFSEEMLLRVCRYRSWVNVVVVVTVL